MGQKKKKVQETTLTQGVALKNADIELLGALVGLENLSDDGDTNFAGGDLHGGPPFDGAGSGVGDPAALARDPRLLSEKVGCELVGAACCGSLQCKAWTLLPEVPGGRPSEAAVWTCFSTSQSCGCLNCPRPEHVEALTLSS